MLRDEQHQVGAIQNEITSSYFTQPQADSWSWNPMCKSCDVIILDERQKNILFHPRWSTGTSAIRGTKILNNTRSYWEISVSEGLFGTSLMFGICTKNTRLGSSTFTDLIGNDGNSWGLSHKGLLWHNGKYKKFCRPFREHLPTTVGLLFDGVYGTLTYFKDGVCLGVGFRDLHKIDEPLYPVVCSTSNKSKMTLQSTLSEFVSLQDRCKAVILENVEPMEEILNLPLPCKIQKYLMRTEQADGFDFDKGQSLCI